MEEVVSVRVELKIELGLFVSMSLKGLSYEMALATPISS